MQFASPDAEQRYDALVAAAPGVIVACDFDGTLSPIVEDPTKAHIHPDAAEVLVALARKVLAIAVVTGRPARQVLDLGGLEEVGDATKDGLYPTNPRDLGKEVAIPHGKVDFPKIIAKLKELNYQGPITIAPRLRSNWRSR